MSTLAAKEVAGSLSEALSGCRELRKGVSGEILKGCWKLATVCNDDVAGVLCTGLSPDCFFIITRPCHGPFTT